MTLFKDKQELSLLLNKAKDFAEKMAAANNEAEYIKEQLINYEWSIFIKEEVPEKFKVFVTNIHNNVYVDAIQAHLIPSQ